MSNADSSLQNHPEFLEWACEKWKTKPQKPAGNFVEIGEPAAGPGLDNFLLDFSMPVLVPRLFSELKRVIKVPDAGIKQGEYGFQFIHPKATLHTRLLDNPLTIASEGGCPTTVGQAFEAMNRVWSDGIYAPLDWSSFAMLVNDQDCGEAFRDDLVERFKKYKQVLILFADKLTVGESVKRVFIVWQLVLDKGKIKAMSFGLAEEHLTYYMSLRDPQTILSVCVKQEDVVMELEQEDETPCRAVPLNGFAVPPSLVGKVVTPSRLPTFKDMHADPNWRTTFNLPEG
ncbi:MAG: hypothetical protein K9M11_01860 [Candidatus Pacebacteria bacterium]|nr:hypothetical protein [Candidatus Paceibacterota bacterium]